MRHLFQAEQWLPYPLELVFAFFSDPQNLPRLMPAWQQARIQSSDLVPPSPQSPGRTATAAGAGTRMTLTFRPVPLAPFRVSWDAEITEFVWDDHFCDTQLRGPFAYWHHCHRLQREIRDAVPGTLLRDEVTYEMPFGLLGEIARRLAVERQFRATFRYRQQKTLELLPLADATL